MDQTTYKKWILSLLTVLPLLASANSSLQGGQISPVSVIDFTLKYAHQKKVCTDLNVQSVPTLGSPTLETVNVTPSRTKEAITFKSSEIDSDCITTKGNRDRDFTVCKTAIQSDRHGIPEDHAEILTTCSFNAIEIVADTNESTTTVNLSQFSWLADRNETCEAAYPRADKQDKIVQDTLSECEF